MKAVLIFVSALYYLRSLRTQFWMVFEVFMVYIHSHIQSCTTVELKKNGKYG